jgi:hypothetical protein
VKRKYISPDFEYDSFTLINNVCANLYGDQIGAQSEFNSVGGVNGTSVVPNVVATTPEEEP